MLEAVRGGTSRHVVDVVRSAGGVEHHVAVPPTGVGATSSGAVVDRGALDALRAAGAVLHTVDMRRNPVHPTNAAAVVRLHRLTATLGPDVIHGHSSLGGVLGRVAARTCGRPAVYTPNGLATGRAALAVERALGPLTTRLVAVSDSEGRLAVEAGLVTPDRAVVIPNGIDLDPPTTAAENLRARLGIPSHVPLIGTVARLVDQKSPEDFVAVAAAVGHARTDVHVLLIGMGPLQDRVDAAVARSGLGGRWHQIPHLPGAAGHLGQLDAFVLPSRFEGGPYTPLEAMRAGCPVVLTDVVGSRDAVVDGVTGLLHPFGDVGGMAASVLAVLDDPDLAQRLAAAARSRLAERFDLRIMGRSLADLYHRVAEMDPALVG